MRVALAAMVAHPESSQAKLPTRLSGFPTLLPEQNKNYLVTLKCGGPPQLHSNVTREFLFGELYS